MAVDPQRMMMAAALSARQNSAGGPQGPGPADQGPPDVGGGGNEVAPIQILHEMERLAGAYLHFEPDQNDKQEMDKILIALHSLMAKDQAQGGGVGAHQFQGARMSPGPPAGPPTRSGPPGPPPSGPYG